MARTTVQQWAPPVERPSRTVGREAPGNCATHSASDVGAVAVDGIGVSDHGITVVTCAGGTTSTANR